MSLQVIRNGLVWVLTTCGPYSATQISTCDFGILEQTSSCAIMLFPQGNSPITPHRYGSPRSYQRDWSIEGSLYIKDTGDPKLLLSRIWQGFDDIYNTISKDDTLNGSACAARLTNISHDIRAMVTLGDSDFALVEFGVEASEF